LASARIGIGSHFDPKGLRDAQKELGKFTGKSGDQFKALAGKAALVFTAVAAGAVVVGKKLIDAGERAATSNARIDNIVQSMGLFSEELTGSATAADNVSKRLIKLAESTARLTGVDQNAIKATQAKLATFSDLAKSADEVGGSFDRATMAAIDLAAAGFGSAEGNAVQLGKALNDPIKGLASLAKSGVTFTESEKDRIKVLVESNRVGEAQALILEAIEKQVGGTAAATANASDRMRVAFSQLQERLGLKLLPLFERFVTFVVDKVMPALEKFGEVVIAELITQFQNLQERIGPVIEQLVDFFGPIVEKITDWMKNNTGTVKAFFAALAGVAVVVMLGVLALKIAALFNPVTLIIGGLALLAAGFKHAWDNSEQFRKVVTAAFEVTKAIVQSAVKFMMGWFDVFKTAISGWIKILQGLFNNDFRKVMEGLKQVVDSAIKMIIQMFTGMPRAILDVLKPKMFNVGEQIGDEVANGIQSKSRSIGKTLQNAVPVVGLFNRISGAVLNFGDKTEEVAPKLESLSTAMVWTMSDVEALNDVFIEADRQAGIVAHSVDNLADATTEMASAFQMSHEMIGTASAETMAKVTESLEKGAQSFMQATDDMLASADGFITGLQAQITDIENWGNNLATISTVTSAEFVQHLADMGLSGAALVADLASDLPKASTAFELWEQRNVAAMQAVQIEATRTRQLLATEIQVMEGLFMSVQQAAQQFPGLIPGSFGGDLPSIFPTRYTGGPVPGPTSMPVPILAHGGEYVLSADIVEAIRTGAPSRGLEPMAPAAVQSAGPAVVIENYTSVERSDDDMLIGMLEFAVRGGRL
jgi:hypothetical protein